MNRENYTPGERDYCQTPPCMVDLIIPHLPAGCTVWEPAAGEGWIVRTLERNGFGVIAGDKQSGQDYFFYEPDAYDVQVTNPPYNQYDLYRWLERAYHLGKPFALVMKTETMGVKQAGRLFRDFGVGVVQPIGRVAYRMPATDWDDSCATFPTAWFTWGLGIEGVNFVPFEMVTPADEAYSYQPLAGRWGQLGF